MFMQVSLSPELEQLLQNELATGKYRSENELLLEAVQLLTARDKRMEELRRQVQIGRDQIDRGECTEFDDVSLRRFFEGLQERGSRRYAERRQTP
jgi:antitoxin ParD1/3/4